MCTFMIVNILSGIGTFLPDKAKVDIARVTIILLMIAALVPTYKLAKIEFK